MPKTTEHLLSRFSFSLSKGCFQQTHPKGNHYPFFLFQFTSSEYKKKKKRMDINKTKGKKGFFSTPLHCNSIRFTSVLPCFSLLIARNLGLFRFGQIKKRRCFRHREGPGGISMSNDNVDESSASWLEQQNIGSISPFFSLNRLPCSETRRAASTIVRHSRMINNVAKQQTTIVFFFFPLSTISSSFAFYPPFSEVLLLLVPYPGAEGGGTTTNLQRIWCTRTVGVVVDRSRPELSVRKK